MMNPRTSPIVHRLTIAALLGTLPRVSEARRPRAANTSSQRSSSDDGAGERMTARTDAQRTVEGLMPAPGNVRVD